MAIDTSGKWWRGEHFADLVDYIKLLTQENYPADVVTQSKCSCGTTNFRLLADRDEGCAQRICTICNNKAFICDSEEYWEEAKPKRVRCVCKGEEFEIGVGYSFRDASKEIRWITVAQRCLKCGVLASNADWKVEYSPSSHLLGQA